MRANNRRLLLHDNPQAPSNATASSVATAYANSAPAQFDSSSLAVTVLVLLSALFFLGFFSVYARRFFSANHEDDQSHRRPGLAPLPPYRGRFGLPSSSSAPALDPLIVRALPLLSYSGVGKEEAGCVVCLSEFEEKETVKAIPACGHVFHPVCIDVWLSCHGSCPLCRSTQLFALSSCREVRGDIQGWAAEEQRGVEEGPAVELDLARVREVDVEVGAAMEEGGVEERGRQVGKNLRSMGRSDRWCCSTQKSVATLRRSRSL